MCADVQAGPRGASDQWPRSPLKTERRQELVGGPAWRTQVAAHGQIPDLAAHGVEPTIRATPTPPTAERNAGAPQGDRRPLTTR
jgi:hypothetical protein